MGQFAIIYEQDLKSRIEEIRRKMLELEKNINENTETFKKLSSIYKSSNCDDFINIVLNSVKNIKKISDNCEKSIVIFEKNIAGYIETAQKSHSILSNNEVKQ